MKKSKKKIILITVFAIIILLGIATWVIVSKLLNPKDLGVKASKEAYESALSKLNYVKDPDVSGSKEPKKVDVKLTSEELTSFFSFERPSSYPLKKVQIKVNENDTVDFQVL